MYTCHICGEDLDQAVRLEREQELDVLRVVRQPASATPKDWSVRVFCSKDHENVVTGVDNG